MAIGLFFFLPFGYNDFLPYSLIASFIMYYFLRLVKTDSTDSI